MKQATPAQQRAERKKLIKQGLQAGLGIVRASREAAQFVRKKHGSIYLKDDGYWLHDIGLLSAPTRPPDDKPNQPPPIVRGHRRH